MKKLLLLMISAILISGCVAQEEPVTVDDVAEDTPETLVFTDEVNGVTFEYPAGWAYSNVGDERAIVFHKDVEELSEWENDGSLIYYIVSNPESLSIKEYMDTEYDECMAMDIPEGSEFGPICVHMDVENWDASLVIDGHMTFISERRGMPASGETAKDLYIVVETDDDSFFINLRSVGTGMAISENEDYIEEVFDHAVETLTFQ